MEEQKKKPGKEEPAKKKDQSENKQEKKEGWFDLSMLSRLASQISDDGKREEKKADRSQ